MERILCIAVFFFSGLSAFPQSVIALDEGDVDLKVITWHYNRYEKSTNASWSVIAHEGIGYFKVSFDYQGNSYEAVYDDKGTILLEREFVTEEKVPKPVIDLLDYRLVKYKIATFRGETYFEGKKPKEIFYRVEVNVKTGGTVIYWFDQDYNLLPDKKDEASIY